MLDFWILKSDEKMEMDEGCLKGEIDRFPDFSIELNAFQRTLDIGLEQIAYKVGLSYFSDAMIDNESCKLLLNSLDNIDKRLNPSGALTEVRQMKELFSVAVECGSSVGVVCD